MTSGGTTATLTLGFTGDFRGQPTVAVRVPGTTHAGTGALTSNAVAVTADAGVTVSESSLSLDEDPGTGGSAHEGTYTVVLDSPPTGCALVRIDVASDDAGVTVSPAMLTFRRTGAVQLWNAPQTVTVTAGQDDDGADVAATVSHAVGLGCSAAGYPTTLAIAGVSVTVDDDETPGIVFDADPDTANDQSGPLALVEDDAADASKEYTVRLATQPPQDVTVTLTSADPGAVAVGDTDGNTPGDQSTLTFTASNWATGQTVTLTAQGDDDGGNESVAVTHAAATASASEYTNVSAELTANVTDDDTPALTLSATTLSVPEQGSATYTVRLATLPVGGNVTVAVTGAGDGITVDTDGATGGDQDTLTFTATNWATVQTVTVRAADDQNAASERVTLTHTATGADYGGVDADLEATAADDDAPQVALALSSSSIGESGGAATVTATLVLSRASIAEAGGVATVTATLDRQASVAVTVTVAAAPGAGTVAGDFTQSGTTLTVAAGATASTGAVTVTAVDNDVDAPDKTVTVSGTASDSLGLANDPSPVTLAIVDDDEKGLVFGQEVVTVAEGGTAGYTVALNSEPTGNVSVSVTSDNADVTISSSTPLTFTTSNWNEAQTVTVMAAADGDDSADTATVSHSASGGGYDGEAGTVEVAVSGAGDTKVAVVAGTREYSIEGRRVTVTVEAGVPDGIEVDLAGVGSGSLLTLTFRQWPDDARLEDAAGRRHGLGPVGSRVVVNVVASGVPAGGVRLCLPVSEGLRTARAAVPGRVLVLLRSGAEVADSGEVAGGDGVVNAVCASGVASFSPFAVGYLDGKPTFEFDDVPDMVFTVDEAIVPVTLPSAAGGDFPMGETLGPPTLAPDLPPGLDLDDGVGEDECPGWPAYTLCGTPTEEFAQRRYTWTTAEDADGQSDVLAFTIEVVPARALARARLKALNASVLPEVARASWDSWTEAVTGRLESPGGGAGEGAAAALAGFVQANEQALEEGASWKELLSGRSFAVALGGEREGEGEGAELGRPVTVWGAGDRRSLSRDVPALKWSGDLFAAHLGADVELGSGVTGGVGVSWFESRVDYVDRGGEDGPVEGKHRTRMASVQPYLGWSWEGGARLWGSVGYGTGEVEIEDKDLVERFGRQRSDSRFAAVAVGGAMRLVSEGALRLDLKGEGQMTRYVVDDNGDLMAGLSVQTQRVRVSAEGTREYALDGGGRVSPSGELGVRWDGGDGATGAGVEVGAGVSWAGAGRVKVEVGGRWLVAHRSGLEEWGLSGGVRVEPEAGGRGLSLSVAPGWGEAGSGTLRLWEEGMAGRGETAEVRSGAELEAELGYGVGAFGGFGVATPYTRLGVAQEERRYGLGWRLSRWPGEAFALDLEASRRERDTARPEHGVGLELRLRW